jgi:hypothetical protein
MKNIQTGNQIAFTENDGKTAVFQEVFSDRRVLTVIWQNEQAASLLIYRTDRGVWIESLADDYPCLDDLLEYIDSRKIVSGWHCPQTLGI